MRRVLVVVLLGLAAGCGADVDERTPRMVTPPDRAPAEPADIGPNPDGHSLGQRVE